ncbi:MAG TPA: sensor histidine kinase [Chloroflexi bacterium]|nr:sensor histidine kinase [Chloroflexota bacterium]
MLQTFFEANQQILYFIYGQVYFVMAIAIALRPGTRSRLELARTLPLLALFGLTQALVEWGRVFIPIQATYTPLALVQLLRVAQLLILALSYAFLMAFGLQVLSPRRLPPPVTRWFPWVLYLVWGGLLLLIWVLLPDRLDRLLTIGDVSCRYLLALPGGVLSAWGLRRQSERVIRPLKEPRIYDFLRLGGIAIAGYTILAGLIVPPAPFFPASWLNEARVAALLGGIPIAALRACFGSILAYAILRALDVFHLETERWIEEMERAQALAEDRERISRELHDGTIQSIYAAGLMLEDVRQSLNEDVERARVQLDRVMHSLNQTIRDIRNYIFDLRQDEMVTDLEEGVRQLLKDFRVNTLVEVNYHVEGKGPPPLRPEQTRHIIQIVREALSNVARHARARRVDVRLRYGENQLTLRIADDGVGFPVTGVGEGGRGLRNMRERAQLLYGALVVEGEPGRGVTVALTVPYEKP